MGNLVRNGISYSGGGVDIESEVIDIRLKADGTTATSAGNAVREQIAELKGDLGNKTNLNTDNKTNVVDAINEVNNRFIAPVSEAVEDWLAQHPEATTTVQDGSVTYEKLNNNTIKKLMTVINATAFGFVGDGITDNSDKFDEFIQTKSDCILSFDKGVYCVSRHINFPYQMHLELGNAEIKAISSMDCLLSVRYSSTLSDYTIDSFVNGGILNCNSLAKVGFCMNKTRHFCMNNTIIYDATEYGIKTSNLTEPDGNGEFNHVLIENKSGNPNAIGLYDRAFDNRFNFLEITNYKFAINPTNGGAFIGCKFWIRDSNLVENSVLAVIKGNNIRFVSCAFDTYQTGIITNASLYYFTISNCTWIRNKGVYSNEMLSIYPSVIIQNGAVDRVYGINGFYIDGGNNENEVKLYSHTPTEVFIKGFEHIGIRSTGKVSNIPKNTSFDVSDATLTDDDVSGISMKRYDGGAMISLVNPITNRGIQFASNYETLKARIIKDGVAQEWKIIG